ncbi:N-acetyl-alpha-D-glucosaminyl L-malate synthase BshA [Ruminiclostridium sufflavum DSM 19573]|uniref:N-acetyl-alpha-D-glucosaminyl L-malate synthase BshA n=1 Tax=Ruminiclostridium sufflavum DSM 19573 TaxID=1121337 RepID=A0A318XNM3_9FIRM|nr:glycosyltransferase family 4 protein [Ruminiclostridium sufflavum]PYG87612.1 N-acetyl-alpha-D-glucosaminyl L-malate synthase BshA [Ruminiclostridium sufflavum DSM 19573]
MKILMLSWEYPPRIIGGISRVVYDLAQNLGESENEVHVLTCWEPYTKEYELDKNVTVHRVHVYNNPSSTFVEWVMQLNFAMVEYAVKLVREHEFDIIHAHDWLVAYAARVIKHTNNIPVITTIHATEYGRNNGIHTDLSRTINNIEKWLMNESDYIIVNSNYMRDELASVFGIQPDKISVISNGVDLSKFDNIYKDNEFRKNYASPNEKIVFYVGRLVNEKGVHVLLNAIPKILNDFKDVKFVIAGKGPCLNNLIELSQKLNINEKVYFTGFVSEEVLLHLYKCSDMAVFPSTYEPFGIVALEGMVAGIPVVVSDAGGLNEIVTHKEDGMKFYNGNSNSLADCILELLKDEALSEKICSSAMEKVHKLYNWNNISKMISDEYKYVISQFDSSAEAK